MNQHISHDHFEVLVKANTAQINWRRNFEKRTMKRPALPSNIDWSHANQANAGPARSIQAKATNLASDCLKAAILGFLLVVFVFDLNLLISLFY